MLKNYLKTAWRNLMKNKTFSFINLMGLAIGIAAFLLIVNYLRFEYSYDDYNIKKDRIFRVPMATQETAGKIQTFAFTYPAVAPAMKKDFPEVEEAIRFRKRWGIVRHGDQKITEEGTIYYVDPGVFNVFSFTFRQGNPATAFTNLNDVVITESAAKKFFGNENPLGQSLNFAKEDFVVTGVLDDLPANSHIQFDILFNYNKYIQETNNAANTSWGWSDFYTYILLRPGADAKALQAKMPAFAERYLGADMKEKGYTNSFFIEPLKDIHTKSTYDYELSNNGDLSYLKYLAVAALLILLIALINYINLSTARSLERSREVGVRKVIGATRFQLRWQFLSETFITNILGILIGILIFELALPQFSLLIGRKIIDLGASDFRFWGFVTIIFIVCTLLAGFYPAFVLSSFKPVVTLKSASGYTGIRHNKNLLRKSLVILQFTAAIVLIGGSIGFYRQLQYMSNRDLGIDIKQTLVIHQTGSTDSSDLKAVTSFINDLQSIPGVETVSTSTSVPGGEVGGSSSFRQLSSNAEKRCRDFGIDEKFIPDYKLSLAAGRNFDRDKTPSNDTSQVLNVILNNTASGVLGFSQPKDAIGQMIIGSGHTCKIIGVLNDFHQESLQNNFDPIVFYPERALYMSYYSMKLNTSNLPQVMDQTKKTWATYFPSNPLDFFFLDEHFNEQYKKDKLFSTILWLFTILAIIVASLGLFGLSLFTVAKRAKEISVRKVLGASVFQITSLITKDYLKLILLAGVIAIPVAYFLLQNWLKDYAFHIGIGYWFFLLPILLIVSIALLTVLYQSLKAALSNPVKSLRSE